MAKVDQQTLLRLVVEACDDARDVMELAQQLAPLLPITCFKDLEKLKTITFRDQEFDVEMFASDIPSIVFPIENLATLVRRVAGVVDATPDFVGIQPDSPEFLRRQMERLAMPGVQASGFPRGLYVSHPGKAFQESGRVERLSDVTKASED